MASMNRVFLAGNLTRDPETRRIPSGTAVCRLGLAINHRWTDRQSGESKEETTFVDIEVWGQPAEFCQNYLHKGAPVLIEGRLRLDQWEDRQTGQKRSKLLVRADRVQSLRPRDRDGGPGEHADDYDQTPAAGGQQSRGPAPQAGKPPPFPAQDQPPANAAEPQKPSQQEPQAADEAFDVDDSIDDIPF